MTLDPRLLRAAQAAALAAPNVCPSDVWAIAAAVLAETDRILEEDAGIPDNLPAGYWPAIEAVVPPQAIYDADTDEFRLLAANPPIHLGDELIVTFEGGVMQPYARGVAVRVAHDFREALAYNRQRYSDEGRAA